MSSYNNYDLGPYQVQFLGKSRDHGQDYEMVNLVLFRTDDNGKETEQEHKCFYVSQSVSEIRRCLHSMEDVEKMFDLPEYSRVWLWTKLGITVGSGKN